MTPAQPAASCQQRAAELCALPSGIIWDAVLVISCGFDKILRAKQFERGVYPGSEFEDSSDMAGKSRWQRLQAAGDVDVHRQRGRRDGSCRR